MEVFVVMDFSVDLLLHNFMLMRLDDLVRNSYNAVSICVVSEVGSGSSCCNLKR